MSGTAQFEVFAEGLAFPEGPVVMADGSVIVVEVASDKLIRCWAGGRKEVVATTGGGPNGLAVGPDGALYHANNGGIDWSKPGHYLGPGSEGRIERIDIATGKVDVLYDSCGGVKLAAARRDCDQERSLTLQLRSDVAAAEVRPRAPRDPP